MHHVALLLSVLILGGCVNGQLGSTEGVDPAFAADGGIDPDGAAALGEADGPIVRGPDETDSLDPSEPSPIDFVLTDAGPPAPVCTRGTARDGPVRQIIRDTFGRHGDAALRVAWCESGPWGTTAQNGQYKGLFQMGRYERATYGHGPCAEVQAAAAHRYFVASGRDWSPWACKP